MMTEIYDLHCHSTASDGALSPCELVQRAYEQGVTTLALTDHDTVAGLESAKNHAQMLSMRFINGIELSAQWQDKTFHIVGLNIDAENKKLLEIIENLKITRTERAEKIASKLEKKKIYGAFEAVKKMASSDMITRTHFADFLVMNHHVTTQQEAFDYYLAQGKSAYVATYWTPLEQAIEAIIEAGGIAVLAHPMRYKLTASWLKRVLTTFKQLGGQGMEIVTGRYNAEEIRVLTDYAIKFELMGSVGSDFHNPSNQWIELGKLAPLPDSVKPIWSAL